VHFYVTTLGSRQTEFPDYILQMAVIENYFTVGQPTSSIVVLIMTVWYSYFFHYISILQLLTSLIVPVFNTLGCYAT